MICIDSTASLVAQLGEASTTALLVHATYMSITQSTGVGAGPYLATATMSTSATTDTTILSAPSSGVGLQLAELSMKNIDSATHTVTVRVKISTTEYQKVAATIAVGETLCYESKQGWYVLTSTGVIKQSAANIPANTAWAINDFRLTVKSGNAVPLTDQTSQGYLYLTPVFNNGTITTAYGNIALSDANGNITILNSQESAGINLSGASLSNSTNYDVFVTNSSGLSLYLVAWSNSTAGGSSQARTTALAYTNGMLSLSGSPQYRYVGTIRTTSTTTTEDSYANRNVYNVQNQVLRCASAYNSSSVTPTSQAVMSGTTASMLFGLPNVWATLTGGAQYMDNGSINDGGEIGIGFNSTLLAVNTPGTTPPGAQTLELLNNSLTSNGSIIMPAGQVSCQALAYLGLNQVAMWGESITGGVFTVERPYALIQAMM